jgi:PilZ domain
MEGQLEVPAEVQLPPEHIACTSESCNGVAATDLDSRPLCLEHFIPACIKELEARGELLKSLPYDPASIDAYKNFIGACAQQAEKLAQEPRFGDRQTKAVLLDFLFRVSQLSQRLRRSPRTASTVPVWLRREDPYRTWQEETWTVTLSRHGAGLLCQKPVEKGGTVVLCRKDKGNRTPAKVVYCGHDSEGRKYIGVEFVDPCDFWDLS